MLILASGAFSRLNSFLTIRSRQEEVATATPRSEREKAAGTHGLYALYIFLIRITTLRGQRSRERLTAGNHCPAFRPFHLTKHNKG